MRYASCIFEPPYFTKQYEEYQRVIDLAVPGLPVEPNFPEVKGEECEFFRV